MNRRFGVVGGDGRQAALVRLLEEQGDRVWAFGLSGWGVEETPLAQVMEAPVILLPLPLLGRDGLLNSREALSTAEVLSLARPEQLLLAGKIPEKERALAAQRKLILLDLLDREELAEANAIPTAEGAIQLAMEQLPVTLWGTEALVVGFGRIGKRLAWDLLGLGAHVTVAARKQSDRAMAEALGCRTLDTADFPGKLDGFRVLFNTVPALLLPGEVLEELPGNCLCVELASRPGFDQSTAETLGLSVVHAGGLPGKVAPETAARAILATAEQMILEWRNQT